MGTIYKDGGRYWGKLSAVQLGQASTGTAQLAMTFTIMGEVNLADPDGQLIACPQNDRTVYRAITEKSKDWFWRNVDALCEAKGIETKPSVPSEVASCDLVGAEVALECKHDTYQGKAIEKWDIHSGGGAPDVKPLDGTEAAKLDALFGRGKPAAKKPAGRSVAPVSKAPKEEVAAANGDVPF